MLLQVRYRCILALEWSRKLLVNRRSISGFTLIEVLMTMVVLGILAALAIPAFSSWVPSYQLKAAAREFYSHCQLAKLTAIKRNRDCTITFNQLLGAQLFDYVVYVDSDNDKEYDNGEEVILSRRWMDHGDVGLDRSRGGGDGISFLENDEGLPTIAFKPDGLPVNNLGGLGMGTVFLKNERNLTARVIISSAGNIRIE